MRNRLFLQAVLWGVFTVLAFVASGSANAALGGRCYYPGCGCTMESHMMMAWCGDGMSLWCASGHRCGWLGYPLKRK